MRTLKPGSQVRGYVPSVKVNGLRVEKCSFDNAVTHGGSVRNLTTVACTTFACFVSNVVVEDSTVDGLTAPPGGGRRAPLYLQRVLVRHVTLRGRVNQITRVPCIFNAGANERKNAIIAALRFYSNVDWALDISEVRFTSVPFWQYAPPGRLFRRDPETQPLVTLETARERRWERFASEIGSWAFVLDRFAQHGWQSETVLMPALGGSRSRYTTDLAGLAVLHREGITELPTASASARYRDGYQAWKRRRGRPSVRGDAVDAASRET